VHGGLSADEYAAVAPLLMFAEIPRVRERVAVGVLCRDGEFQFLADQPMAMVFHYVNVELAAPWLADVSRNEWGRWRMWTFPERPR